MFSIYKLTFSNGKCYVGQTKTDLNLRLTRHKNKAYSEQSQTSVHKAFRMHGIPTIELIEKCDKQEIADTIEKENILKHNTLVPNGYNLQTGGVVCAKHNQISKDKVSVANKGRDYKGSVSEIRSKTTKANWQKPEYREKLMASLKESCTDELRAIRKNNIDKMWKERKEQGWQITEEHRAKLRASARARPAPSEEKKAKVAEKMKQVWAKRKAQII